MRETTLEEIRDRAIELDQLIDEYLDADRDPAAENNHGSHIRDVFSKLAWIQSAFNE